ELRQLCILACHPGRDSSLRRKPMKTAEISRSGAIVTASLAALAAALAIPSAAQAPAGQTIAPRYTYVDLVELGQAANLVLKAQIRRQSTLGPERSPGLKPGWVRLYLEA